MVEHIMAKNSNFELSVEDEALLYVKLSDSMADAALTRLVLERGFSVKYMRGEFIRTRGGISDFGFWFDDDGSPVALGISKGFIEKVKEGNKAVVERLGKDIKQVAFQYMPSGEGER